jgi:hypothetical protein
LRHSLDERLHILVLRTLDGDGDVALERGTDRVNLHEEPDGANRVFARFACASFVDLIDELR